MATDRIEAHPDFCFVHGRVESVPEGQEPYCRCGECGHLYLTAADLERAADWKSLKAADWKSLKAADIHFCQECLHDW